MGKENWTVWAYKENTKCEEINLNKNYVQEQKK